MLRPLTHLELIFVQDERYRSSLNISICTHPIFTAPLFCRVIFSPKNNSRIIVKTNQMAQLYELMSGTSIVLPTSGENV